MTQPDPNAQSGAAGTQSGAAGQPTDPNQPPTSTPPEPPAQSGQQPPTTVSREEYEAIQRRMQASDQNNSRLQAKLKEYEDAQLTEQQKTANALKEAQDALAAKDKELEDTKLQNALLADKTYDWHNPATALSLVDRSAVQWKDGKPQNIKALLDTVAKDHAYLIKTEASAPQSQVPAGATAPAGAGSGGTAPGNGQSSMEERFPALRGRVQKRG